MLFLSKNKRYNQHKLLPTMNQRNGDMDIDPDDPLLIAQVFICHVVILLLLLLFLSTCPLFYLNNNTLQLYTHIPKEFDLCDR